MKSIPDIYGGKGQTLYYCIGKDCKWQMIG